MSCVSRSFSRVLCGACFMHVLAAYGAAATPVLDEITVTAQKRQQSSLEVPLSLQVVGDEEIEANKVGGISSLRGRIPGLLTIPHPNADSTLGVFLRGVGNPDEQLIQDPSVAIYVDGFYLARNQGLGIELAELDRIEILKGPQGTLYGRNASGGAINLVTRTPGNSPWRFVQQLSTGNRDLRRLKTRIDLKLSDELAIAAAYLKSNEDGFVANAGTGASHFGSRDRTGAMLDLAWQPAADWSFRAKLDRQQGADSPVYIDDVPLYPLRVPRPSSGDPSVRDLRNNNVENAGVGFVAEHRVDEHNTVRYLGSLRTLDDSQYQDFHSGVTRPGPVLITLAAGEHDQESHEIQWVGASAGATLEYVAGVFWFHESAVRTSENRIVPARSSRLVFGRDVDNLSRAVFGQLAWKTPLLDGRLKLVAGGRQSQDKRVAILERATGNLTTGTVTFNPALSSGRRSFSDFSPSAGLLFDLNESVLAYLRHEQGYKSGGFNARASTPQRYAEGFEDEQLGSWEFGIKADLTAIRSRVQLAVFDTSYDRIQLEVRSNPLDSTVSDILNAGAASLRGIELELESAPFDGVRLALSYSGLRARYGEVMDAAGRNVADNYRFVGAPHHALHAALDLELRRWGLEGVRARFDYGWQDRFYSSATLAGGRYRIPAYGVANISLHYERPLGDGELALGLWVRNLADTEYYLGHFNGGTGAVIPSAIWGTPRSSGLDLEYRF